MDIVGVPLPVVGLIALFTATVGTIGYLSLDEAPAVVEGPPSDPRPPRSHVVVVAEPPAAPPFDWAAEPKRCTCERARLGGHPRTSTHGFDCPWQAWRQLNL